MLRIKNKYTFSENFYAINDTVEFTICAPNMGEALARAAAIMEACNGVQPKWHYSSFDRGLIKASTCLRWKTTTPLRVSLEDDVKPPVPEITLVVEGYTLVEARAEALKELDRRGLLKHVGNKHLYLEPIEEAE